MVFDESSSFVFILVCHSVCQGRPGVADGRGTQADGAGAGISRRAVLGAVVATGALSGVTVLGSRATAQTPDAAVAAARARGGKR
jgi:hypothetical protein